MEPTTNLKFIVMEHMDGGSLHDLLFKDRVRLTRTEAIRVALDVAKGMQHLHSKSIIHRDLKSANILVRRCFGTNFAKQI